MRLSGQVKADSVRAWKFASGELKGNLAGDIYLGEKSKPRGMVWTENAS